MRCRIRAATIAGVLLVFLATAAAQVRLSTISGRVLTSDGKPCPDAAVLAIPEPSLQTPSGRVGALLTKTDTEGRYRIVVSPGRYAVATQFARAFRDFYYPGTFVSNDAGIVTVSAGAGVRDIVMRAPEVFRASAQATESLCESCPYPQPTDLLLAAARITDTLVLFVRVTREGTVGQVTVIRGHSILRSWGVDPVRKWRYRPQMVGGKPVEFAVVVTLSFPPRQTR